MNWLDWMVMSSLLFFAFEGFRRSFISELLNFFSFLSALFLSLSFYSYSALIFDYFWHLPRYLVNVSGFITIWIIVELFFFALIRLFFKPNNLSLEIDKVLNHFSFIPSLLRGVVFISIILVILGTFPIQPKIKKSVFDSLVGSFLLEKTAQLENPLKNVFGGITTESLNFLTVKPKSGESIDLGFKTSEFNPNEKMEFKMIELVNYERKKKEFGLLTYDPGLRPLARIQSEDMFLRGYFSHYSPEGNSVAERAQKLKIDYLIIGENLAFAPDLTLAHNGLMNSPGHRANILSPEFHHLAIGIMENKVYGLMITQVFSD